MLDTRSDSLYYALIAATQRHWAPQEETQMTDDSLRDIYTQRWHEHVEAGDDEMNATLRIIEEGCPVELANEIEMEEGDVE